MNPTGLPLLLATLLAGFGASVALFIAIASDNRRATTITLRAIGVWAFVYAGMLVTTSVTSENRLLGHGQRKALCGFYLDCHVGVTVERAEVTDRLYLPDSVVTTDGQFIVVDLTIDNDAVERPMNMNHLHISVEDLEGRKYSRRSDLEFEINHPDNLLPEVPVKIQSDHQVSTLVVFEVAKGVDSLRMYVTKGNFIERILEFVLIGDEDSFLHAKSYHRL